MIGLTAFTKAAVINLLEKISSIQKRHNKINDFTIITLIKGLEKQGFEVCETNNLLKRVTGCGATVVGGTIWDWHKVREESSFDWAGCDIMIIDEGSQVGGKKIVNYNGVYLYPIVIKILFYSSIVTGFGF